MSIPMKRPSIDKSRGKGGSRPSFGQMIARNKPHGSLATGDVPAQTGDSTQATPAAGSQVGSNSVTDDNYDFDGGADSGGNLDQMEGTPAGRQNIPPMKGQRFGRNNVSRMAR